MKCLRHEDRSWKLGDRADLTQAFHLLTPISHLRRSAAFSLLEIVIALTVFVIAITGLFSALQQIGMNSAAFAQDREIQYGLEAILAEARHLPVSEMTFERVDETQGVRYTMTVEPANLANVDGEALDDLYLLRAAADFDSMGGGGTQIEAAEIYVYQPEERAR